MDELYQEVYELLAVLLAVCSIVLVYAAFHYAAMGISCFRMMRNAGMTNPWRAWVPYCSVYALGDMADHYNILCEGKATSYGKKLLAWHIVVSALSYPLVILLDMMAVITELRDVPIDILLLILVFLAFLVVYRVFYSIALYKIYRLFAPAGAAGAGAAGLTVLSVLVPVAVPVIFLILSGRKPRLPFDTDDDTPATPSEPSDADTGYYSI